jgi:RimJ/RimL family protein N-acetyltransferase
VTDASRPVGSPVDPSPAQPPGSVTLSGRYGRVARLDAARDAAGLWRVLRGHDDVWTYMPYGPFVDERAFSAWLAKRETLKDPYYFTALDTDGRPLGLATLMEIRPLIRVIEVGHIVYSPALQRTPLGTETQYLLARYAFDTLSYRRYEWKCDSLNAPSRRAAARYGFVFEGILRQHMIVKGRNRDTAYFSMLDSEWPARQRNFELWLRPENFDGAGRQRLSLAELDRRDA